MKSQKAGNSLWIYNDVAGYRVSEQQLLHDISVPGGRPSEHTATN